MSWTFVACVGIAFAWMTLFYLWGRGFLTAIRAETDVASCIPFGYVFLQAIYHVFYLPFYFTRGSYRGLSYLWLSVVIIASIAMMVYLRRHIRISKDRLKGIEKAGIVFAAIMILCLSVFISLHVPFYGQDTVVYISTMNESYYKDSIWLNTRPGFHHAMCSMFQFFTTSSLLTGIKPYYISLFTVRIVGVCLFSLITYRIGSILFKKTEAIFSWIALTLSIVCPYLLMFWGSNYTAEFFYWRINEAKGYGQFVLLPLGFSIFLGMMKDGERRGTLWKQQFLVGFAAVSISASTLAPYLFLQLMGTFALLAYDKLKNGVKTIAFALICSLPNLGHLVVYILANQKIIVL